MTTQDSLKKGTAAMVVLHLLSRGDRYVYQISQELAQLSEERFTLQEGSLYPTLYRLQEKGDVSDYVMISEKNQRLRKYYSITDLGRKHLEELKADFQVIIDGILLIMSAKSESSDIPKPEKQENNPDGQK